MQFEKPRRKINKIFKEWVTRQPCSTCGAHGVYHETIGEYLNTPSHLIARGSFGPDEGNIISQCFKCHVEMGKIGQVTFEKDHGVDLKQLAESLFDEWKRINH